MGIKFTMSSVPSWGPGVRNKAGMVMAQPPQWKPGAHREQTARDRITLLSKAGQNRRLSCPSPCGWDDPVFRGAHGMAFDPWRSDSVPACSLMSYSHNKCVSTALSLPMRQEGRPGLERGHGSERYQIHTDPAPVPGRTSSKGQLNGKLEFLPFRMIHYLQQHLNETGRGSVI